MIVEDDKIVLFGMSCVGKTTFAKELVNHSYYCFDDLLLNYYMQIYTSIRIDKTLFQMFLLFFGLFLDLFEI